MPLLWAKKEVFEWLKIGKKTIDVRKGNPMRGDIAVFTSGPHILKFKILKKENGQLGEIIREDNFGRVIPSAQSVEDAVSYLRGIYRGYDGVFTAYYLGLLKTL